MVACDEECCLSLKRTGGPIFSSHGTPQQSPGAADKCAPGFKIIAVESLNSLNFGARLPGALKAILTVMMPKQKFSMAVVQNIAYENILPQTQINLKNNVCLG